MLNYKHRASSKRHLRFVDAVPEEIYRLLFGENASVEILALQPPDDSPKDEREPSFIAELEYAKATDVEYLTALQGLENTGHDDEIELAKLERELRDRLRIKLDFPPRPDIDTINPIEHARELGINPLFELSAKPTKDSHKEFSRSDTSVARIARRRNGENCLRRPFGRTGNGFFNSFSRIRVS